MEREKENIFVIKLNLDLTFPINFPFFHYKIQTRINEDPFFFFFLKLLRPKQCLREHVVITCKGTSTNQPPELDIQHPIISGWIWF